MRNAYSDSEPLRVDNQLTDQPTQDMEGLPNRLLTAREVANTSVVTKRPFGARTGVGCSGRSDSASEEGGFIPKTSSTGFVEAHQRRLLSRRMRTWRSYEDAEADVRIRGAAWSICGST